MLTIQIINSNSKFTCVQCMFPGSSAGKESACNAGDLGSIPGMGRYPGEGEGSPLQYSDLENPRDCIVHGVAKRRTQPSNFHSGPLVSPQIKFLSMFTSPKKPKLPFLYLVTSWQIYCPLLKRHIKPWLWPPLWVRLFFYNGLQEQKNT